MSVFSDFVNSGRELSELELMVNISQLEDIIRREYKLHGASAENSNYNIIDSWWRECLIYERDKEYLNRLNHELSKEFSQRG